MAAILLLGASLRLLHIQSPLLDAHRWRQVDTAAIARNLYEDSFNVFYPQVDWGGSHGYVESEFPILPALTALGYEFWGPHDILGRLVAVVFSVGAIWALYALGTELLGPAGGRAAAFLLAVSPNAVYYGRTVMPEAPMLFFSIVGVLGFLRYFRTGSHRALWWGAAATALAGLSKLPALVIVAPIVGEAWRVRGRRLFEDRAFCVALGSALLAIIAWYVHALFIYRATGLTLGIFFPTQTYPLTVGPGPWQELHKWSTLATLTDPGFYLDLLVRLYLLYLTPVGLCLMAVGLLQWRGRDRRIVPDLWLLAVLAFILAVGKGNRDHDYYQIPLLPVAALYFAVAAAPAFDGAAIGDRIWRHRFAPVVLAVIVTAIAMCNFYLSGVVRNNFRPDNLDVRSLEAGRAVERVVPPGSLVIAVDEYGVNSPMLLYYAHRRGWSFDVPRINLVTIDQLRRSGATFFATTQWSALQRANPHIVTYLRTYRQVGVGAPPDVVVFNLSQTP